MKLSINHVKLPTRIVLVSVALTLIILAGGISFLPTQGNNDEDVLLTQPQPPVNGEDGDEGPGRLSWFYLQRAYPMTTIPPAARAQALEQMDFEETWMKTLSWAVGEPSVFDLQPAWTPLGPAPIPLGQTSPRWPLARLPLTRRIQTPSTSAREKGI